MMKQTNNENQSSPTSAPHNVKILSESLSNAVARAFAILELSSDVIGRSSVPSRKAGITILEKHLDTNGIVCEGHTEKLAR